MEHAVTRVLCRKAQLLVVVLTPVLSSTQHQNERWFPRYMRAQILWPGGVLEVLSWHAATRVLCGKAKLLVLVLALVLSSTQHLHAR